MTYTKVLKNSAKKKKINNLDAVQSKSSLHEKFQCSPNLKYERFFSCIAAAANAIIIIAYKDAVNLKSST
jgi:hypothetical protein